MKIILRLCVRDTALKYLESNLGKEYLLLPKRQMQRCLYKIALCLYKIALCSRNITICIIREI